MVHQSTLRHLIQILELSTSTGIFTIPNHFFNTNEELTYTPDSTFIGIAATAMSIGSTANTAGVVTTLLPTQFLQKLLMKINSNYSQDLNMLLQVLQ